MELMSANELYEVSRIKHNDKTIADALWRAAKNESVELFMHGIDEMTKKKLLEKGYHVEAGNYPVGEEIYEYRIYLGKEINDYECTFRAGLAGINTILRRKRLLDR